MISQVPSNLVLYELLSYYLYYFLVQGLQVKQPTENPSGMPAILLIAENLLV